MAAFVADRVAPAQYRGILSRIHKQEAYLDSFMDAATDDEKAALEKVMNDEAAQEVQRMRDVMANLSIEGGFGVNPTYWFQRITDKVDGLYEVEKLLIKNINSDVNRQLSTSRSLLLTQLILAVLAIVIAVAVSMWVARSVSRPLQTVVDAAEYAVKNDDFTRAIPEEGTQETARVGQAINHLMAKFRDIISHAVRSSEEIANASGVLATASEQVNRSSSAQSDAASSVAAAVEEISVSVSETAGNARTASEVVEIPCRNRAGACHHG